MLQKTRYLRLFLPFMLLCVLLLRLLSVPPSAEQQLASCFGRQLVVYGAVEPLSVRRQEGFSSAVLRCQKVYSDTELRQLLQLTGACAVDAHALHHAVVSV